MSEVNERDGTSAAAAKAGGQESSPDASSQESIEQDDPTTQQKDGLWRRFQRQWKAWGLDVQTILMMAKYVQLRVPLALTLTVDE